MNEKAGRNDPCPCGSGKKYKNCHWGQETKKIFTPSGKRRFKATVISTGAQAQQIFQHSASTQKMPEKPGEYGVLNKIKQCEADYRVEQVEVQKKIREILVPKEGGERRELPEIFPITEEDFRTE